MPARSSCGSSTAGPGIPEAEREQAFAPFQRRDDLSTSVTPGVGLGLAIARGFTEAMSGELTMEDTPGGGLTVVITLPAVTSTVTSTATATAVTAGSSASGAPESEL